MERFFPGTYDLVTPGADPNVEPRWPGGRSGARGEERPVRIAFCLEEERGALRFFLRALRRLPVSLPWEVAVWTRDAAEVKRYEAIVRDSGAPRE